METKTNEETTENEEEYCPEDTEYDWDDIAEEGSPEDEGNEILGEVMYDYPTVLITLEELFEKGLPEDRYEVQTLIKLEDGTVCTYEWLTQPLRDEASILGDFLAGEEERYLIKPDQVKKWLKYDMDMSIVDVEGLGHIVFSYDNVKDYFKNGEPTEEFYKFARRALAFCEAQEAMSIHDLLKTAKKQVIGQDEALEQLCSALWFYKKSLAYNADHPDHPVPKSNILIQGASGTGKTFSVEVISKIAGIPVVILDASKLVPTAYRGQRIVDSLAMAVKQLEGDLKEPDEKAAVERFNAGVILVYDEADKLLAPDERNPEYNLHVQGDLLKMMEGATYDLSDSDYLTEKCRVDTKNVLFILSGAFAKCEEQKRRALEQKKSDEQKEAIRQRQTGLESLEWKKAVLLQKQEESREVYRRKRAELEARISSLELEKLENLDKARDTAGSRIQEIQELDEKISKVNLLHPKEIGFLPELNGPDKKEDVLQELQKERTAHMDYLKDLQDQVNKEDHILDKEILKCRIAIQSLPEPAENESLLHLERRILSMKKEMWEGGNSKSMPAGEIEPLTADDLVKYYGIMPEIVGRLQTLCHMKPLDQKDLLHILTSSESSALGSYRDLFREEGWKLTFRRNALEALAEEAYQKHTGARGIQAVLNQIIFRVLKDVEGKKDQEIIITKSCVTEGLAPEIRSLWKMKETALAANF